MQSWKKILRGRWEKGSSLRLGNKMPWHGMGKRISVRNTEGAIWHMGSNTQALLRSNLARFWRAHERRTGELPTWNEILMLTFLCHCSTRSFCSFSPRRICDKPSYDCPFYSVQWNDCAFPIISTQICAYASLRKYILPEWKVWSSYYEPQESCGIGHWGVGWHGNRVNAVSPVGWECHCRNHQGQGEP